MAELFTQADRLAMIRAGEMSPPIRVVGGEIFGYRSGPIAPDLELMALNVRLVEIQKREGIDLVLWAPADWYSYFKAGVEDQLGMSAIKLLTERPTMRKMPYGVRVLRVGEETDNGGFWPVWLKHIYRPIEDGKMVEIGVPLKRNIFPTTRDLITAVIEGAGKAAAEVVKLEKYYKGLK